MTRIIVLAVAAWTILALASVAERAVFNMGCQKDVPDGERGSDFCLGQNHWSWWPLGSYCTYDTHDKTGPREE